MTEAEAKETLRGLGENLGDLMKRTGVSRREVLRRTGMSETTLKNVLSGRRYANLWTLIRIREALGCTWADLMGGEECNVKVAHPDMGGFHEYVCGTMRMQFKYRGDLNHCPICGRRANVRS